ncbi:MAG: urea transporter [Nitrososphaerales archaeon]
MTAPLPTPLPGANIVDYILDGVSQVFFVGSPLTGIIFLIGLAISSLKVAGWAVLGTITGGALAFALGVQPDKVYFGLWGFNSVLTAIALGSTYWERNWAQFTMAVSASFITAFITSTNTWFVGVFGLPVETSAFVAVTWVFLFASQKLSLLKLAGPPPAPKQRQSMLKESVRQKEEQQKQQKEEKDKSRSPVREKSSEEKSDGSPPSLHLKEFRASGFVKLIFTGIAQVFFQENWITGVLIFIGMTVATIPLAPFAYKAQYPIYFGGITCFIASLIGTLTAIALKAEKTSILRGLYGFNSVLTAVAVMGVFLGFFMKSGSTPGAPIMFGIMLFGAMLASIATAWLTAICHDKWKVPTLTAPFVLTAWFIELASYLFPNIVQNPANLPAPPFKIIIGVFENGHLVSFVDNGTQLFVHLLLSIL